MKALALASASLLVLGVGACAPANRTAAITTGRLTCPERSGELTRVSAATDGKSCVYRVSDGADVTLELIPVLAAGPEATLKAVEDQLVADAGTPADDKADWNDSNAGVASGAAASAKDAAQKAMDEAQKDADDARHAADDARREAERAGKDDSASDGDWSGDEIEKRVNDKLREKGLVDSDGDTGEAHVRLPGIRVDADGSKDSAHVQVGPLHIDANGKNAKIRTFQDVRLRGEGFSPERRGVRAMFIYSGDQLRNGYSYVGYDAAGPKTGPLVVAIVKSKQERHSVHGDIYNDVKRLVHRNGGI